MDVIKSNLDRIRVAGKSDKVFKDECFYSFDAPESPNGLYICLNRFLGIGERYLEKYSKRTDNFVFLQVKRTRKEADSGQEVPEKVSRLAINIDGGFNTDKKQEWEETRRIVVLPSKEAFEVDNADLPAKVVQSVTSIVNAVSANKQAQIDAASGTWDGEILQVSKHAENLTQVPNPPQIPPSGWKCEKCDLKNNLWLNLTDGTILCGRRFFDGSGGNNHAVDHYQDSEAKGPLAVKLGTISKDGKGDVFSYDEDEMVLDPHLEKHLAHFGIRMGNCEKTDRSMVEIQIEMNEKIGEWSVLTESGCKLQPVWGKGKTGFHNLGNTCYMNSVLQVLLAIPEFRECYSKPVFFDRGDLANPADDLRLQMSKLAHGVASGDYSLGPDQVSEEVIRDEGSVPGIKPLTFKNLIGKGHHEFSSNRQQDAQEFFLHLLTKIERAHHNFEVQPPSNIFHFKVEDRIECSASGQVQYKTRTEYFLPFNIPLEAAINKEEVEQFEAKKAEAELKGERIPPEEEKRFRIPFSSVLESFLGESLVEDFYSPAIDSKTVAKKSAKLKTFPPYLLISLSKYQVDKNWQPIKLNVEVDMPDELDLNSLRGAGAQPGEVLIPEQAEQVQIFANDEVVGQLVEMGFNREGCRRAVHETKNTGLEAALAWVMEHMGDPDFSVPFNPAGGANKSKKKEVAVSEENVAMVMSMGFTLEQAKGALQNTDNNVERAIEWIFSHPEGVAPEEESSSGDTGAAAQSQDNINDGEPKYKLQAFISHMGTSPQSGHYVCHIRDAEDESKWFIFNDNKVAISEKLPKDLGYLYIYKRK